MHSNSNRCNPRPHSCRHEIFPERARRLHRALLSKHHRDARTGSGEDGRRWVEVSHGEAVDFYYSVQPRAFEAPAFAMSDTRGRRADALKYWRADVYLPEGGQDYDVMGWSKESVINDVLDHYHRHLNFLEAVR